MSGTLNNPGMIFLVIVPHFPLHKPEVTLLPFQPPFRLLLAPISFKFHVPLVLASLALLAVPGPASLSFLAFPVPTVV